MRRLGGAAAAAATVIILLTGCGTQTTPSTVTPSVTVAPSSPLPTVTVTTSPTPSASASGTAAASPSASSSSTASAGDSGAPADQCPDADLGVSISVADGGGGGAGSEYYNVLFTNVGGSSCVLRGTPGVSVAGGGSGTQVGPAADRIQTGVKSVRLGVGETAAAPLKIVNIGTDGGPLVGCTVAKGDGYRVYPPHSKKAFFVKDADAVACTGGPVFMTASPVIRFTD